jgi:hypothetical protein
MINNSLKAPVLSLLAAACCLAAQPVLAQDNALESLLKQCAGIDHDRQRLSCYDQVLRPAKLDQPEPRPAAEAWETTEPVTPAPAAAAVAVEEEPPPPDNFGLREKESRETVVRSVTVTGISKNLTDKFLFRTEDDQVWIQIDTRSVRYDEVPFEAEIRTAALGSFFLKSLSSGVSVKVRRIR